MEAERSANAAWPSGLYGRGRERAALLALLDAARTGRGRALLLAGEPGSGRTALLDAVAATAAAARCTLLSTAGTAAETAVPLAGLQRMLLPVAGLVPRLPPPHAAVLAAVLAGRPPPDGELVLGTALFRLTSVLCAPAPLLWCVDDAHLLDTATLRALGMAARRLAGTPAALLLAVDEPADEPAGDPAAAQQE
ncbi:ATP-binding protein, partial [Streptomyces sp. NPDC058691]|uniref:ATP-binding protein n=1 Tax=Streptomyces sp. NPDC058691 TaxID=3346601 RepID=UPI00365A8140